ncbi:DMT family transporter [Streptomyces roseoverticillatus]|uniref:DMT family transporter n=1 Tax=Streptomyces roseoverticillatus TaxID=66429 RepID=UPI001F20A78B|nr:DMT family transporter [Streptomyces roseoverticillatus]
MRSFPAILFAVLAAVSNALAVVLQRRAARTVPLAPGLRLSLFAQLLRRKAWLGGMAAVMAAACLQALALSQGAMAVVQPVFVLELPFALLLGGLILGRKVTGPAWRGAVCIAAGLGLALAAAAPTPTPGTGRPPADRWLLALGDALVSLSLGITLYEERVRSGWWLLPEAAGAALVLYGAVTISRVALARDLVTTAARTGAG